MDKYARSFQQGVRRPVLLLLLLMASFFFYATMHGASRQGDYAVHAQSSDSDTAWVVKSFIWNQSANAWARTNCTMTIGGLNASAVSASSQSACSNIGRGALSFLQYYHDTDPDDTTPKDRTDDVYGKIKGRAWSPLYGVIYFDPSDFPSSGAGASCYGLTGDDRQVRIEREGDVRIVGCAYVPLLRDYILFNRSDATHSAMPSSSEWGGVHVLTVEDAANAYLVLRGCAWSSSNGFWSFGANQSSADGKQNCLPSGHNTALKKALPESRVGTPGNVLVTVRPTRSSLKIGQEVGYEYSCPSGYNTPSLTIGSKIISAGILALFRGSYSEIFTDPVSDLLLACTDGTEVFTTTRRSSGAVTSSVRNSFFISSFTVTPSVLTEGGFVSFGGFVSNQGGFSSSDSVDTATGHCDNTARYGCIYGVANETVPAATDADYDPLYYQWRCDGTDGAPHSGICQMPKERALNQEKIVADDGKSFDRFGRAVALDGNTALIGADREDTNGADAGAAYVFTRSGTGWVQQAKIVAKDAESYDHFGRAVALDGDTALIGADGEDTGGSSAGAAYVFIRSGTGWVQQAKIVAKDAESYDHFGRAVALDGDTALIGADGEDSGGIDAGAAYVFTRFGTNWSQQAKIQAEEDKSFGDAFGRSVALDGNTALIGAGGEDADDITDTGAAYLFTRSGAKWSQPKKLVASDKESRDNFGHSVALDGDTVLIGADGEDSGGTDAGAAYSFTRSGTDWVQQPKIVAKDKSPQGHFGRSVALDGDTALIGADADGSAGDVYLFTRSDAGWDEQEKIQAGDENRGTDDDYRPMAIDGNVILIGADGDNDGDNDDDYAHEGAAYFYADPTGLCDNTVRNGCAVGTADADAIADTPAYHRWRCSGVNGGKDSGACQISTTAVPGNEGYCTITNKVTKQELQRFNVDGVNVAISGSDLAVRDVVYDLQCRYKKFTAGGVFEKWLSVSAPPVAVKVLPRNVSERDASDAVDPPVFSVSKDTVSVSIPSGAAMVYVYRLDDSVSKQATADSLFKVFVDRSAVALSGSDTVDQLKNRLFERAVRGRVQVVGSRSGDITKSAVVGKSLIAAARTAGGVWSQQVVYTLSGDGDCDETAFNRCTSGILNDIDDSDTHYLWRCDGIGSGEDSRTCAIEKSSVIAGDCKETVRWGCAAGTVNKTAIADDGTRYWWRCEGSGGGDDSDPCSILRSSVIAGVCRETVRWGCAAGTVNKTFIADSDTHYQWRCDGKGGGDHSRTCAKRIPIDGGWTDWTPLPATARCGSSFTQTRSCTNPTPAYDGANCVGSPSRDGVGTQCPTDWVCESGGCVREVLCPQSVVDQAWLVNRALCRVSKTDGYKFPDGHRGDTFTIRDDTSPGIGSAVFECGDQGWSKVSQNCS